MKQYGKGLDELAKSLELVSEWTKIIDFVNHYETVYKLNSDKDYIKIIFYLAYRQEVYLSQILQFTPENLSMLGSTITMDFDPIKSLFRWYSLPEVAMLTSGFLMNLAWKNNNIAIPIMTKYILEELDGLESLVNRMSYEERTLYDDVKVKFVGDSWDEARFALSRKEKLKKDELLTRLQNS